MRLVAAIAIGVLAAFVVIFALRQPAPETGAVTPPPMTEVAAPAEKNIHPDQIEMFGKLASLVGLTFVSEPAEEGGLYDTQVWEWALDGNAILIRHALSDGSYGGDTYIFKDKATGKLAYHYITNAGFATVGEMTLGDDGSWSAIEAVSGHEKWTHVRSTGRQLPDGRMVSEAEYTADGETWTPGHSFTYSVAPAGTTLPRLKFPG